MKKHQENSPKHDLVHRLFSFYQSDSRFHFKWFRLDQIVENINVSYAIPPTAAITVKEIMFLLRKAPYKLAFSQGQQQSNEVGVYRSVFTPIKIQFVFTLLLLSDQVHPCLVRTIPQLWNTIPYASAHQYLYHLTFERSLETLLIQQTIDLLLP